MAYYGANGNDVRPRDLITEAVQKANPNVNYADFDNNNDGYVDGVHVIYAGYAEAAGAPTETIWPHKWNIPNLTLDGKTISAYSCSSELRSTWGTNISGIGTICHELGHVLGASDFYDTNYATGGQFTGTGQWDLMAQGSWNGDEDIPAHHNPYTKTQVYNWATVQSIPTDNSLVNLSPANSNSNSFYKISTSTSGEYFLIENRQQLGFDSALPGHGMMVYHVHSQIESDKQTINTTFPQKFYPVCASATQDPNNTPDSYGNINSSGCPFPGSSNKTAFTDNTFPSAKSWLGIASGGRVNLITELQNNVMFVVNPTISGPSPVCTQGTYTINNLPTGATVVWSSTPSGIVSGPATGNPVTFTKVGSGKVTLSALINNSFTVSKDISVGIPYSLAISSYSNLTMWDASDFQVLPSGGLFPYEGVLSLSDDAGLATSYSWSFVSSTAGKVVNWSPNGGSVDVAMKTTNTFLHLKCTASNSCGSYSQIYTFTTGTIQPMIITPNPSSTQAEVSITDASEVTTSTLQTSTTESLSATSYTILVVDSYGITVYSAIKKEKKFTLPTSSFRNGIYAVIVSDGINTYQNKLIVRH